MLVRVKEPPPPSYWWRWVTWVKPEDPTAQARYAENEQLAFYIKAQERLETFCLLNEQLISFQLMDQAALAQANQLITTTARFLTEQNRKEVGFYLDTLQDFLCTFVPIPDQYKRPEE